MTALNASRNSGPVASMTAFSAQVSDSFFDADRGISVELGAPTQMTGDLYAGAPRAERHSSASSNTVESIAEVYVGEAPRKLTNCRPPGARSSVMIETFATGVSGSGGHQE